MSPLTLYWNGKGGAVSLDLSRIAAQVGDMIHSLRNSGAERRERLATALRTLQDPGLDHRELASKISNAKTSWLVGQPLEPPATKYPCPALPADFTIIATDGSNIDIDRHQAVRCYLINTGRVTLTYGSKPGASLTAVPNLYADDEHMVIPNPGTGRDQVIDANLLGIIRSIEEWRALAELASGLPPESSALALIDGTLIQWGLEGKTYPQFVKDTLLVKGFLRCLDDIKKLNDIRRLPMASYISFPGGADVVNALRIALCPGDVINDDACAKCRTKECEQVNGLRDRDIFNDTLAPGERSGLFASSSTILEQYGDHKVCFFYLNAGGETGRVEVPKWVADDRKLLDLTHALIYDQCRRGQGYPVALSEAHEQAVITGADRENFWRLVEAAMSEQHIDRPGSAKSLSKRTRWL